MTFTIKRSIEGIECLVCTPKHIVPIGKTFFIMGSPSAALSGIHLVVPLTDRALNTPCICVEGTPSHGYFTAISPGSNKVGFPQGSNTESFSISSLSAILQARYGHDKSLADEIQRAVVSLSERDQDDMRATLEAFSENLLNNRFLGGVIPMLSLNPFTSFLASHTAETLGADHTRINDIISQCSNFTGQVKYYVSPDTVELYASEVFNHILTTASEHMNIAMCLVSVVALASFSSVKVFNKFRNMTREEFKEKYLTSEQV